MHEMKGIEIRGTVHRGLVRKKQCPICKRIYKLAIGPRMKQNVMGGDSSYISTWWPLNQCGRHMDLRNITPKDKRKQRFRRK